MSLYKKLEPLPKNEESQVEILFRKYHLGHTNMEDIFNKLAWYYDAGFSVGKYIDKANDIINKNKKNNKESGENV